MSSEQNLIYEIYSRTPCREQVFFPVLSALFLLPQPYLPYFSRSLIVLCVRCQKCRENPRARRGSKLEARTNEGSYAALVQPHVNLSRFVARVNVFVFGRFGVQ